MRIDMPARHLLPLEVERVATAAENAGFDGLQVSENQHDPFIASALAARATTDIGLTTAIAVAFARNPMTVATSANDIHGMSAGRFTLGLGSQVRAHIERRFSMPWSAPAPRMEEFVGAVRAIWHSWASGMPLAFDGQFYRHTLMTPFFNPGPNEHGNPPIWVAGLGPAMTKVAGRVADGFFAHPFTTPAYLREVTLPALASGRRESELSTPIGIGAQPFIAVAHDFAQRNHAIQEIKRTIAFYASTPSYRPLLEFHGWEGSAEAFTAASKRQEWGEMSALVSDEMLDTLAVIGTPTEIAVELQHRFSGLATSLSFTTPVTVADEEWTELRRAFS